MANPDISIFSLSGKTVAVTGAGSGLGRVFSSTLASFGAEILCLDRDRHAAQQTCDLVAERGGKAKAYYLDVADQTSVDEVIEQAKQNEGFIDVLINNAGITCAPTRLHEMDAGDWQRVVDVNLTGTFRCTKAFLPLMLQQGGSIINISSIMGGCGFYPGFPGISASYNAAKAGIAGLTRQIAAEYSGDNIRCNAIAPGWHQGTNLGAGRRSAVTTEVIAKFDSTIIERTPMQRKGLPEELRGLVVLLASDASSFITGQVFVQDGGWSAI